LKLTADSVIEAQLGTLLIVPIVLPTQKMRDSGMVPERVICNTVAAAVVPLSIDVVYAASLNVSIRKKNVVPLTASGLCMPLKLTVMRFAGT